MNTPSAMIIQSIQFQHFALPLKVRFAQANQSTEESSTTLLRLETQAGTVGWGESCPRPYVTGESPASVAADLQRIVPQLIGRSFVDFEALQRFILEELVQEVGPSTVCALDLALLDAWAIEQQTSLVSLLGGDPNRTVHYSGILPMASLEKTGPLLQRLKAFAFRELKLKVGTDLADSLARIRLVQDTFGPEIPIRVDANTDWTADIASAQIPPLVVAGVQVFEQPLPKTADAQMEALVSDFGHQTRLMADESLTTLASAAELVRHRRFNHFNLKISKQGGLLHSLRLYRYLRELGYTCQLGAHFGETTILTMAGVVLASLAPDLLAQEGGLGTHLLERDVCEPSLRIGAEAQLSVAQLPLAWGAGIPGDLFTQIREFGV